MIGLRLESAVNHRDLALFNMAIDRKLRGCDLVRLAICKHELSLDLRVKRAARNDEVCLQLVTVPEVGPTAALTFKAAVDDPGRFKRFCTVGSHFGLYPRRYQSGEHFN